MTRQDPSFQCKNKYNSNFQYCQDYCIMVREAIDLSWLLLLRIQSIPCYCNSNNSSNKLSKNKSVVQPEKNASNDKQLRRNYS